MTNERDQRRDDRHHGDDGVAPEVDVRGREPVRQEDERRDSGDDVCTEDDRRDGASDGLPSPHRFLLGTLIASLCPHVGRGTRRCGDRARDGYVRMRGDGRSSGAGNARDGDRVSVDRRARAR
jgi:hypothetical protein